MLYNLHRDYNPALGRYVQSDPIGLNGGPNTYTYVAGNAVALIDLSGLAQQDVEAIDRYITNHFPDITRADGYVYGDPGKENDARTNSSGVTTLPKTMKCKKLSFDEFYDLFKTMLHESMHSTDVLADPLNRTLDAAGDFFGITTAHHRSIYSRENYETIGMHNAVPGQALWGKPTKFRPNIRDLYNESRNSENVPCDCY